MHTLCHHVHNLLSYFCLYHNLWLDLLELPADAKIADVAAKIMTCKAGDTALQERVKQLEKQMAAYARDLEFEKAAAVRDQLDALKKRLFGASVPDLPEKA